MPLKDTLSALRRLILAPHEFSESQAERAAALLKQEPGLTKEEAEELARIPREGLKTYTTSIFTGEGALIEKFMPRSHKLIKENWGRVLTGKFSNKALALAIHENFSWKSFNTYDLLTNCHNFIVNTPSLPPELRDLSLYEASIYKVRRGEGATPQELPKELLDLTVSDYLNLRVSLALNTVHLKVKYAVHKELSVSELGLVISRDANNKIHTSEIQLPLLAILERGETPAVEELADYFVTTTDPTAAFVELSKKIASLVAVGALVFKNCGAGLVSANI